MRATRVSSKLPIEFVTIEPDVKVPRTQKGRGRIRCLNCGKPVRDHRISVRCNGLT